jgi:hypothetical protein
MSRSQIVFLFRQTLTAIFFNGLLSAIAVSLVFRHLALVPLYGSPGLIVDSILQTFGATFMSTLQPSRVTAKWMLARTDQTAHRTPPANIWRRALLTALAAGLASWLILPFAMPRLFAVALPFRQMLVLKCIYGMAIGLAATPFAVAAVLRGPRHAMVVQRAEEVR